MTKHCGFCGEKISSENKEKVDKYRGAFYCEKCSDEYWENVEELEGIMGIDRGE